MAPQLPPNNLVCFHSPKTFSPALLVSLGHDVHSLVVKSGLDGRFALDILVCPEQCSCTASHSSLRLVSTPWPASNHALIVWPRKRRSRPSCRLRRQRLPGQSTGTLRKLQGSSARGSDWRPLNGKSCGSSRSTVLLVAPAPCRGRPVDLLRRFRCSSSRWEFLLLSAWSW